MGRPNFNLLARQQRQIGANVGETAVWQGFVSANSVAATAAAFGEYGALNYNQRTVTGLFALPPFAKDLFPGGQLLAGDIQATIVDFLPGLNDRITWRGVSYRVESQPVPQQIVGRSAFRMLLRRGDAATG